MAAFWQTDRARRARAAGRRLCAGVGRALRPVWGRLSPWVVPPARWVWKWAGPVVGPMFATGLHTVLEWASGTRKLRVGERALLGHLAAGPFPGVLYPTRSRVDVGYWFGRRRVWCGLWPDRLLLFAFGRRPFAQWLPVSELGESLYNHVTGEVILAPASGARCWRLRLAPLEGYEFLERVAKREVDDDA